MPTRFLLVDPINQQESKISGCSVKLVNTCRLLPLYDALSRMRWGGRPPQTPPENSSRLGDRT